MDVEWGVFFPELIVGALTTLGFGFILWQVQKRSEARQFRHALELTWAGVRARTVRLVNGAGFFHRGSTASDFGALPRDLIGLCEDRPLDAWFETLRDPDITILRDAVEAMENAVMLGERLDLAMHSAVLRLEPVPVKPDLVEAVLRDFAYGSTRQIRLTVFQLDEAKMRDLERAAIKLVQQPGLEASAREFRTAHRTMLRHIRILEETFPKNGQVRPLSNSYTPASRF